MTLLNNIKTTLNKLPKSLRGLDKGFIEKNRKSILIASLVIALAGLGYLSRGLFVAAFVNGHPITRLSVLKELEKQGGSQTLDNLVTRQIIFDEAKNKGINVSDDEVNSELKNIEDLVQKQDMTLDQALSLQNQKKEDLIEQIKIQKLVEKILSDKLVVSDSEIQDYFTKNKDLYAKDLKLEDVKGDIKNQLAQSKLSSAYQTWISDLKSKAKILYFVKY